MFMTKSSFSQKWAKNPEECPCLLCGNNFEGCVTFLNGRHPTNGIEATQKPLQAAGCARGRFVKHERYFHSGSPCSSSPPTHKERWYILNIIHAQVAVGSRKRRLLAQKNIFCFIHNRWLSVMITPALWWNAAGRDERRGGITGAEK